MNHSDSMRHFILRLLARRDYSQYELKQKLYARDYVDKDIDTLFADLIRKNLINDNRFTENYIHWRARKGYGPKRIYVELQARGISDETIAEHLNITDNSWFNKTHQIWLKFFKGKQPTNFKDKVKQMRFLQYRGFTFEQIESVFKAPPSYEE